MNSQTQTFQLADDGQIPNNPDLPVIIYKAVFKEQPDEIEAAFNRHQWTGSWTGGVYDYHHYHSNTHEVLGVKAGQATVLIGGDQGERLELHQGDVILLPAGTGHKNAESSPDFEVVGAYPGGKSPNMKKKTHQIVYKHWQKSKMSLFRRLILSMVMRGRCLKSGKNEDCCLPAQIEHLPADLKEIPAKTAEIPAKLPNLPAEQILKKPEEHTLFWLPLFY